MIKVSVTGIKQLRRDVGAFDKKSKRALDVSIKAEGFRQLRLLRDSIKKGTPGGQAYSAKLSKIAGRTKSGRLRKNQIPLYRLARLLRYNVNYQDGNLSFNFGFIHKFGKPLSRSWKRLLSEHQEGANTLYSRSRTELGKELARIGGRLKRKGDPDAKYFFLRRTTGRKIKVPKRPIISPHWRSNEDDARRNIADNFRRKMRGERI